MIPLGSRQKPLLEYIVRLLRYYGIKDIIMLVNYKSEQIKNYFENGDRFGIQIRYLEDDPGLKGSGSSIIRAISKMTIDSPILIYYGDILSNLKIDKMLTAHQNNKAQASLALSPGFRVRVGVAEQDPDGRILKFVEKPKLEKPVNTGLTLINKQALEQLIPLLEEKTEMDFYSTVIPYLINHQQRVFGFIDPTLWWYDIGSIERFEKLENATIEEKLGFLFNSKE